jgi:hypothetical protein|nr:MAG TPA: hypothetical protein [Caudoviricetes sp.]
MNKLIILFSLTIIILCSCKPSGVSKGRIAYKEYFNKTLKDPSSLVIHSEEVIAKDESSATFVLDIGAKNSYGGMVRQTYTIRTIGKGILDVKEYDTRSLSLNKGSSTSKNKSQEHSKPFNYTYKGKMTPVAGFYPEKYIGAEFILKDSCIFTHFASSIQKIIQAIQNKDADEVFQLGGILPKGEKIKIISIDGSAFKVDSKSHEGIDIYIEQSAIF